MPRSFGAALLVFPLEVRDEFYQEETSVMLLSQWRQ